MLNQPVVAQKGTGNKWLLSTIVECIDGRLREQHSYSLVTFIAYRYLSDSPNAKLKVKLPRGRLRSPLSLSVVEGQPELDDPQHIHICLRKLILVVCLAFELAIRLCHHTRKLCVLVKEAENN